MLVRDHEHGGIKSIEPFPVLLQPMHMCDDIIALFGVCLNKGTTDGSSHLIAALLVYGNQGLSHGIGSIAMSDIDELIVSDALPNKDLGKSVIEKPSLGIFGLLISIGHRESPINNGKEFTELKKPHDFFLPLSPVIF